jgi:two-component system sensor histidine kinase KdpD
MEEIASAFGSQVVLYLPQPGGRVRYAGGVPSAVPADDKETAVAQWVFDHGRQAGHGTDTLQAATFLHFPVAAHGQKTHAVLGLYPPEATAPLDSEQRIVLNSLVSQTALALEVDTLEAERQRSESRILSELFRHSILSSVSHELRTPMASILGCASSLLDKNQSPDQGHQEDLLKTIRGEALHMDGLVTRLLDMTRFETLSALKAQSAKARAEGPESSDLRDREPGQGVPSSPGVQLRLADLPVDALIGSALTRLRQKLRGRGVETSVDPATPPVHADEVFVRLVLLNLLENGIKDSPPHSPLSVRAFPDGKWVRIEVADRGHGLQPEECDLVFGKVFRDGASQATRGAGLGLAIAQFIVRAHHGSISASNRPGGGTVFSFTLPAGNAAAQAPETALP